MRAWRRWWRVTALLLVAAMVAVACGGDDDSDDGGGAVPDDEIDTTAVLKVGYENPLPLHFDPATAGAVPLAEYYSAVYGSLFERETPDGKFRPSLAEEAEIVDDRTLRIRLRDGLVFTDGTPLDAEALKFSIERTKAANNVAAQRANVLATLDRIDVEDDRTIVIRLNRPFVGQWYDMLPDGELMPVSPTAARAADAADPKVGLGRAPVGAGPFMVESWTPERVVLVKNPDYFAADDVKMAGIEIVRVTPDARVNALLSGEIDVATVGTAEVGTFERDGWEVRDDVLNAWYAVLLNRTQPPLSEAKVRQALNFAIDREAISETVFAGAGDPRAVLIAEGFPFADELEPVYEHDPDRARRLLAEAGYPNGFELTVAANPGDTTRTLEVIQPQLAEVGIRLNIRTTTTGQAEFFQERTVPANVVPQIRPLLSRLATCCTQGGFANIGNLPLPTVEAIYNQLSTMAADDPKTAPLLRDLQQELMFEEAISLFMGFVVEHNTWNSDRIAEMQFTSTSLVNPSPAWPHIAMRKQ